MGGAGFVHLKTGSVIRLDLGSFPEVALWVARSVLKRCPVDRSGTAGMLKLQETSDVSIQIDFVS